MYLRIHVSLCSKSDPVIYASQSFYVSQSHGVLELTYLRTRIVLTQIIDAPFNLVFVLIILAGLVEHGGCRKADQAV